MDVFSAALDYVHATLSDLRACGGHCTASVASLDSLSRLTAPAVAAPVRPPAVVPEARPPAPVAAPSRPAPALPPKRLLPVATPAESGDRAARLAARREQVLPCVKCLHLAQTRTQVVFGTGSPEAELMFVGEAPGEDEDRQGEPFVGRAGQLLTKMITAMGYSRETVYIANILKCRPNMPAGAAGNRKPTPDEMKTCLPYLEEQIAIIRPRVLVALGGTAMQGLGQAGETPIGRLRGRWHDFQGIPMMATYHPSYLLRGQPDSEKRKVWEDMLLVLERLEQPISARQRNYFLPRPAA